MGKGKFNEKMKEILFIYDQTFISAIFSAQPKKDRLRIQICECAFERGKGMPSQS